MLLAAAGQKAVVGHGLTLWAWARAGLIVIVACVVAVALRRVIARAIGRGDEEDDASGGAVIVGRIAGYVVMVGGLVYALAALDVKLGPLLGAIGIGGIALAFALQDMIENLIAGVMLQTRRPFRRGHLVRTGLLEGKVEDVNMRVTVLRTFDGERVLVPNASVLKNPIINYSQRGARRTTLMLGLGHDTDLVKTKEILVDAVAGADGVRSQPEPAAWVEQFGPATINVSVRFWHAPDAVLSVRDAAAVAIKQALDDAGIELPTTTAIQVVER
jgi:small-conductance mechanosensitive channel